MKNHVKDISVSVRNKGSRTKLSHKNTICPPPLPSSHRIEDLVVNEDVVVEPEPGYPAHGRLQRKAQELVDGVGLEETAFRAGRHLGVGWR